MTSKKVLFLNPPSHEIILRDNYCSSTTKTDYYWIPIDLLLMTGSVRKQHQVLVIDAIVSHLTDEETFAQINHFKPDFIICLSSILSVIKDLAFLDRCKEINNCKNILIGDIFYFRPNILIKDPRVDAILLQSPASGLLDYLNDLEGIHPDIIYKKNNKIIQGQYDKGDISYGVPEFNLFQLKKYRIPLMKSHPFVPLITSLSCPMTCSYCPVQDVPFRKRNFDEIFLELDQIKKNGIKEILMGDMMFNSDISRAKNICKEMISRKYNLGWFALMRPDKTDYELLSLSKKSGCHTISFGIESTDDQILKNNQRIVDLQKITECFQDCNSLRIKSLAIILIGLPGETKETAKRTIDFICKTKANYISINMFTKRVGSKYMANFSSLDEIFSDQVSLDSTKTQLSHCELTTKEIHQLRSYAFRKFYFNPIRIFRILKSFRTQTEIKEIFMNGITLLWRYRT